MALNDDDPFAGGPSGYYNPEFAVMAMHQPYMFGQHLARNNVQPPPDFDADFDHIDARKALGAHLKDQSQMPQSDGKLPQQGSFEERFSDAQRGPPGMPFANKGTDMPIPPNPSYEAPNMPKDEGVFSPSERPSWLPPVGSKATDPASRFGRWLKGDQPEAPTASAGTPAPGTPLPRPRPPMSEEPWSGRPHVDPEPLPASDTPSTAGGAAVPSGTSQERPGNLNIEDPSAKATSSTAEKKEAKKLSKDDSVDSFGKALAGLSAMKTPTPVFPHPGNLPHPSNQISRSTLPTELLKELSQFGRPAGTVRLGALLKGR